MPIDIVYIDYFQQETRGITLADYLNEKYLYCMQLVCAIFVIIVSSHCVNIMNFARCYRRL